jgi:hypothetical protein
MLVALRLLYLIFVRLFGWLVCGAVECPRRRAGAAGRDRRACTPYVRAPVAGGGPGRFQKGGDLGVAASAGGVAPAGRVPATSR